MVERNSQTPRVSITLDPLQQGVTFVLAQDVWSKIRGRPAAYPGPGGVEWVLCTNNPGGELIYLRGDLVRPIG